MNLYFDRDGQPITLWEWADAFGDHKARIVAQTEVEQVLVSTVWLGIDHSFGMGGPPLIFETMIFGSDWDQEQWRWPNEALALAGHREIALAILEHRDPDGGRVGENEGIGRNTAEQPGTRNADEH